MTIVLPKNDENKNRKVFRPMSDKTSLLGHFDEGNLDEITGARFNFHSSLIKLNLILHSPPQPPAPVESVDGELCAQF